ncbi:MAG: ATP-binding cassette domain-containing protein [Terracidiphilus sp.]|jgi:energy-coupling factor transport system ATP-binding protein
MTINHRIDDEQIVALIGPNFSGRTQCLRAALVAEQSSVYIGPEISNHFTGLALTINEELTWGRRPSDLDIRLIEKLRLAPLLEMNPFSISGGEQALLAIAAGCASNPDVLAIDCVFEQLSMDNRLLAINLLSQSPRRPQKIRFVDNRLGEYISSLQSVKQYIMPTAVFEHAAETPHIDATLDSTPKPQSCSITIDGVDFSYKKGKRVLNGVTFEFKPGPVYILRGDNGAGKTTLAKVLAGLLRPSCGSIRVDGRRVDLWREPGSVVSYHFQNPDLQLLSTSVIDELRLGGRAFRPRSKAVPETAALLQLFGLGSVAAEHPLDLPFVLRKRVAIAAAFATARPWVILDEPTLGQDAANCDAMAAFFRRTAASGQGLIIITHSDEFACKMLGHTVIMEDGLLRTIG